MKSMKTPRERRPLLSILRSTKMTIHNTSEQFGMKIRWTQWSAEKVHAKFSGPGKPSAKKSIIDADVMRKQSQDLLTGFMRMTYCKVFRMAMKSTPYINAAHVTFAWVNQKQKIRQILRQYVDTWSNEDGNDAAIPHEERFIKKCSV